MPNTNISRNIQAEKTYRKAIAIIKYLLKSIEKGNIKYSMITEVVEDIIKMLASAPDKMILLSERATPESYLYGHSVNVCVLSLFMGKMLRYRYEKLEKLGVSAYLHDIGMIKVDKIVSAPRKLTPKEFLEVKKHPEYTVNMVERILDIPEDARKLITMTVLQIHERKSGKGYPMGIKAKDINEYAGIIGIIDTYEALTHPRNWHNRYLPHDAIKMLLEISESEFDIQLVNRFINNMSLYPPGSYVQLTTKEVARVVGVNRGLPKNPKVEVVIDPKGFESDKKGVIDLRKNKNIHIVDPVDETKLKLPDKKLSLKLNSQKWWMTGVKD